MNRARLRNLLDVIRRCDVLVVNRIDTSSAAGEAFLGMPSVFAEFETTVRRERQVEGIAAAKAKGVCKGRPPSIERGAAVALKNGGLGAAEIANRLRVSRPSVHRVLVDARQH